MKSQFSLFVLLLVSQMTIIFASNNNMRCGIPRCQNKNATINITVDNILDQVSVNGMPQMLPLQNLDNWTIAKTIKIMILNPGDVVSITGRNMGNVTLNNPAAILATIWYVDQYGNKQKLNTGKGWICDGSRALLQAANNDDSDITSIWVKVLGHPIKEIDDQAQWIWNQNQSINATCSVVIPGCCKKRHVNNY